MNCFYLSLLDLHCTVLYIVGKKSKTIFDFWLMLEKGGFQFCAILRHFVNIMWLMLTLTLKIV